MSKLDYTLNEMSIQSNPLDAEAKLYFFLRQAERISQIARAFHAQMHEENSIPGEMHDDNCLEEVLL